MKMIYKTPETEISVLYTNGCILGDENSGVIEQNLTNKDEVFDEGDSPAGLDKPSLWED